MAVELPEEHELNWSGKLNTGIRALEDSLAEKLDADALDTVTANLAAHVADTDNPHAITKGDLGLNLVDNTSDAGKPISTATQTALNLKANATDLKFILVGNLPGELQEGDIVEGGILFPTAVTLARVIVSLNIEGRGGSFGTGIHVIKRAQTTGVETILATTVIPQNNVKRRNVTFPATAMAAGDRLFLRVTAICTEYPGSGLTFTLGDSNLTQPTVLAGPDTPTSFTAEADGEDVVLEWTPPATGVYHSVDIWRDGGLFARVLKGTDTYVAGGDGNDDHEYEIRASNNDGTSGTATATYEVATGINTPVEIGSGTSTTTNTTAVCTLTTGVAVGDHVVVMLGATNPATASTWAVTDGRSNTYAVNSYAYDSAGPGAQAVIASCKVTTALQSGDSITFTISTGTIGRKAVKAYSVHGLATSSHFDKQQTNTPSGSTRFLTTNSTATLSQAAEVAFAAFCNLNTALPITPGTGWTIGGSVSTASGTNDRTLTTMWRISASTTALTGSATLTTAAEYAGAIATYKGA